MSKAISRRDFIKVTGAVGAAGLLAACGGNSGAASSTAPASSAAAASVEAVGGLSSDPVTLTMSWWGGVALGPVLLLCIVEQEPQVEHPRIILLAPGFSHQLQHCPQTAGPLHRAV